MFSFSKKWRLINSSIRPDEFERVTKMGKIKGVARNERWVALNDEATTQYGETNDCSVKCLAILADVSYDVAHAAMKARGRKNRQGCWDHDVRDAFRKLTGKHLYIESAENIIKYYPGNHKNLKHMTTYHPIRFKKVFARMPGKFMVFTCDHVVAVVDGEIIDWSNNKALRVESIWRVVD